MLRNFNFLQLISLIWSYTGTRTLTAGSYSSIKTIQAFTATYASNGTTATATLGTAVTVAKSFVIKSGETIPLGSGGTGIASNISDALLTGVTTVTVTRSSGVNSASNGIAGTVSGYVVEFY